MFEPGLVGTLFEEFPDAACRECAPLPGERRLVLFPRRDGKIVFEGFADVAVERDFSGLHAFPDSDAHPAVALREVNVRSLELGELGEAQPGIEQEMDDRRVALVSILLDRPDERVLLPARQALRDQALRPLQPDVLRWVVGD